MIETDQEAVEELVKVAKMLTARDMPLANYANVGERAVESIQEDLESFGNRLEWMTDNLEDMDDGSLWPPDRNVAFDDFKHNLDMARRESGELKAVLKQLESSWKAVESRAKEIFEKKG